jgi:hypothetical protein
MVEPWLRGTLTAMDAVRRAVLHALELAREDVELWCAALTDAEMEARPCGLPSLGFHMRHIVRSLDRLLTYAEGRQLSEEQIRAMKSEMESSGSQADSFREFKDGIELAMRRVREIAPGSYEEARGVGRPGLPSSVGGLLVHCADHTQRHVGQAVTTAKVVVGMRP